MICLIFGNTGIKGEQALINKIDEIDEGYFLVQNFSGYKSFAQNPIEAINYIRNNFQYIGSIDYFDIFYKK